METLKELGCQGIPFQGDEGNDNFSCIYYYCEKKMTLRWLREFSII